MRPPRQAAARSSRLSQLRALALIGFALVGPAGLPAGGAEARMPELRRRQRASEPLSAPQALGLRCEPQQQAPVIAQAAAGAPLRPLRRWFGTDGERWLQVELPAGASGPIRGARRGWLLEAET
jgi:hypothetical protein